MDKFLYFLVNFYLFFNEMKKDTLKKNLHLGMLLRIYSCWNSKKVFAPGKLVIYNNKYTGYTRDYTDRKRLHLQ